MSGVVSEGSGGRGKTSQDFEINIASIIDAFTVLIAFMLVSASYLSIGILDAGVAAGGLTTTSNQPPSVNVTVEIARDKKMTIKVTGKATQTLNVDTKSGEADFDRLLEDLGTLKGKWTDLSAVTLIADEAIEYKNVVKSMEMIRKKIPVVLLGGF